MTSSESIRTEQRGRVGIIRLDRPEALNALNRALTAEIVDAARAFDDDLGVGAIVLIGSERAFAAGADIKEMRDLSTYDVTVGGLFAEWGDFVRLRTPTIAAVSGYALGGGCEVAMMCDLVIAAEGATFGQPEITLGIVPGMGGTQRLTRAVGKAKAMDLILTGRTMDAEEAERAGLVARVVPADRLEDEALEVAARIASMSLPVVYAAKEAVNAADEATLSEGVRLESRIFAGLFALDDRAEGMTAFTEKRAPRFTHR